MGLGGRLPAPARLLITDLPRGDVRAAIASESLGCHDLVVHRSQIHAMARPGSDVIVKCDGVVAAETSVGGADAPVLSERSVALNVRAALADLIDVVGTAIAAYRAQRLCAAPRWRERPVGIHDVILDQRVGRPTVKGQVSVRTRGKIASIVADNPGRRSRVPAFPSNHVPAGAKTPAHTVIPTTEVRGHSHAS